MKGSLINSVSTSPENGKSDWKFCEWNYTMINVNQVYKFGNALLAITMENSCRLWWAVWLCEKSSNVQKCGRVKAMLN